MSRWTISVPDELADRVEAKLDYGDSRSEWVCGAMRQRLDERPEGPTREAEREQAPMAHPAKKVDLPASVDRADAAAAVDAVVAHLRERGPASMRQLVTTVGQDHPLGYDIPEEIASGERYRGAWWRRVVKPALEQHPDVEAPPTGKSEWRFVGE